jgi:P4 family phage/plasmid primase-like protien
MPLAINWADASEIPSDQPPTNIAPMPDTPNAWFAAKYPQIREELGDAVQIKHSKTRGPYVADLNDDFFTATLGPTGTPGSPTVYLPSEDRFYVYSIEQGIYLEVHPEVVKAKLSDLLLACKRECETEIDQDDLAFKLRGSRLSSVVDRGRARLEVPKDFFEKDRAEFIACANGMLRLSDRQLFPFGPEYQRRNKLAIQYVCGAACPRFLETLVQPAMSAEDVEMLQRWLGQVLLGENLAQVIMILSGTAGGGKGTIVRVINGIVGPTNVGTLRTRLLGERFELGGLLGKTLLYGPDVPPDFLNHSGAAVLKSLTGGDPMTMEFKGSNVRPEIICRFNVAITCNSRLRVNLEGDVEAWRRRLRIIGFRNPPPANAIANLSEVLLAEEGSGILNWALDGLDRTRSDGWRIRGNEAQQRVVDDLLLESESYTLFAKECVVLREYGRFTLDDCFAAYVFYCNRRGWAPLEKRDFSGHIEVFISRRFGKSKAHDVSSREGGERRGWHGLGLTREFSDEMQRANKQGDGPNP